MSQELPIKLLFVCHGNICRSPIAEYYFKSQARKAGLEHCFEVSSAATSSEEIGNPVYPLAKRVLAEHGIGCRGKVAQQMTAEMYDNADLVVVMDQENIANTERLIQTDDHPKLKRLLDFVGPDNAAYSHRDVADPWYTRNFNKAWDDITVGCNALLKLLTDECNLTPEQNTSD